MSFFKAKHDWHWGTVPLVCRFCGVERTKQNDKAPCPKRGGK